MARGGPARMCLSNGAAVSTLAERKACVGMEREDESIKLDYSLRTVGAVMCVCR